MENFSDMFKMDASDFVEEKKESIMYRVSPKNGKNGVYSSLVRFVPWYKDPKNSLLGKWSAWLENPLTKKGMSVDCPSSLGKPSELRDIYWKLKNSGDKELEDKAKYFSRKNQYFAIVQILKDENNPELEGKLKVWKFGQKIYDKIQAELKPEYGTPHVPFDPFEGRAFHIKCKQVGEWPNYDECKFLDQPAPIVIDKEFATPEKQQELVTFLTEQSPNLDDFQPKEWTDEQRRHFNEMVKIIVPSAAGSAEKLTKETPSASAPIGQSTDETKDSEAPKTEDGGMNFNFNNLDED